MQIILSLLIEDTVYTLFTLFDRAESDLICIISISTVQWSGTRNFSTLKQA